MKIKTYVSSQHNDNMFLLRWCDERDEQRNQIFLSIYNLYNPAESTIQSVSFSFRNPSSSLKNNISTNWLKINLEKNIAYSNPVNHYDHNKVEGSLIF